ncbi:SpaA isopeptide-forming pilin-related protein [Bifidobacterium sp. ESL0682]|uniref:SpaA isopeptide-forming pilin-related protein n=1 Tax=Bifidobacterium sp. ESL0682 TaxID=2983212 RepID=UPI0023F6E512|nr:SpaA isopeptide-forming pilin-related protein [Bifidobacterium sp. ESL0682]WEV42789.1 SpaA isopeptide-forming pilin-related protein [Bifidobacterium sp. ESL0682]
MANSDLNAEASDQVQCAADPSDTVTGRSATLTWIVPGDTKRQVSAETKSSYMRLRITDEPGSGPHGIIDIPPTGLTTSSGEVEDYKADVHSPTLTVLTNIGGTRKSGDDRDQFDMSYNWDNGTPGGVLDGGPVTTTGNDGGIQQEGIRSKSVGPYFKYFLSSNLITSGGSTSTDADYNTRLDCVDLTTGLTVPHNVDGVDGKIQMPDDFDANVQCTYTRVAEGDPAVTLVTEVHNDNGGTAEAKDFTFTANGTRVSGSGASTNNYPYQSDTGSDSHSVDPDFAYTFDKTPLPAGYTEDPIVYYDVTNPTAPVVLNPGVDGKYTFVRDHHYTATRVLHDSPAKLTLKTVVDNTYGGTATSTDFNFTVIPDGKSIADGVIYTQGNQQTAVAGKYTVSGSDKPGYSQVGDIIYTDDSDPTHTPLSGMALQLALDMGKSITGVRKMRSNPVSLTITTHIAGGGNATTADFPVTATRPGATTSMPDNTAKNVASGTYTIATNMSAQPGYQVTDKLACVVNNSAPVNVTNGQVALINGQNVVCEQTVAPKGSPTLTFETQVLGNGQAKPTDFHFSVTPAGGSATTYTQGKAKVPGSTNFTVIGSNKAGYAQVGDIVYYANDDTARAHPMSLADAQQALRNGRSVTGVRQVKPTSIKVHLDRDYRYGGTAQGDGSKITVNPPSGSSFNLALDTQTDVSPGTFSVRQFLKAGYKLSDIQVTANGVPVTLNADGSFGVNLGDEVVVTLKNVDEPGTLQWSRFDRDEKTLLSGSQWRLTGPNGQTLDVTDCTAAVCTGADQDPTPGKFSVTGLKWGDWTITETVAPAGHKLSKPLKLTLNPAEGKYGLLKTGAFHDGKSVNVTPGANPGQEPGAQPGPNGGVKPNGNTNPTGKPNLISKPGLTVKPNPTANHNPNGKPNPIGNPNLNGQNGRKGGPRLSKTGTDIALVVVIAFSTLGLGFALAAGTRAMLRRREE